MRFAHLPGNGADSDGRSCICLDEANQATRRVSYVTSGMMQRPMVTFWVHLGLRGGAMGCESRNTHTKSRKFFDIKLGGSLGAR